MDSSVVNISIKVDYIYLLITGTKTRSLVYICVKIQINKCKQNERRIQLVCPYFCSIIIII